MQSRLAAAGLVWAASMLGCSGAGSLDAPSPRDLLAATAPMDAALVSVDAAAPDDFAAGAACHDPNPPDGGECLLSVSGPVVDEKGMPLNHLELTVCGTECIYGASGADGRFLVSVGHTIVLSRWALLVHGRPDRVSYYVPLPDGVKDVVIARPMPVPKLPASGPQIAKDMTAQHLTSDAVTLVIPANTSVLFDVEDVANAPAGEQFRSYLAADPKSYPFVDPADPPAALFAFAPYEVTFSQKVPLQFATSAGLAPGAAVDVYRQFDLFSAPAAGTFAKVARAHVSMDGQRITMDPGEGVTELSWMALRKAP